MYDDVELRTKYWPAYALRKKAQPFDFDNPPGMPRDIKGAMIVVMEANNGIGLAGPQLNFPYRVFVMGVDPNVEGVFNPEIISQSEETETLSEGCISFPGIYVEVTRPKWIEVKYQNIDGEWQNYELHGYDARVFMHEYSHLDGHVFLEGLSKTKITRLVKAANKSGDYNYKLSDFLPLAKTRKKTKA